MGRPSEFRQFRFSVRHRPFGERLRRSDTVLFCAEASVWDPPFVARYPIAQVNHSYRAISSDRAMFIARSSGARPASDAHSLGAHYEARPTRQPTLSVRTFDTLERLSIAGNGILARADEGTFRWPIPAHSKLGSSLREKPAWRQAHEGPLLLFPNRWDSSRFRH